MAGEVRQRLVVKRQRCSDHGLTPHALVIAESAAGKRMRRELQRTVCLECDPREFVRLQAEIRR